MRDARGKPRRRQRALQVCSPLVSRVSCLGMLALAACAPPPLAHYHDEFLAMGTTVSIDVVDADPKKVREAIASVRSELEYLGREWYPWENNGELVRLNKAISLGQKAPVSPALANLLIRSQELHRTSGGHFDPAVGRLVELWGFHRNERDAKQAWPDDAQLDAWQNDHPTIADINIEDRIVSSRRRDLLLDLGAIGKGRAVDIGMEILKQHGFGNALINAGGNLRAIGAAAAAPQRLWRVAIRNPRGKEPIAWLELRGDESLSTSGDYERFGIRGAERVNHIVDPRTGRSATHTVAVTVVASDATLADASSTAIFVAGPRAWRTVARGMGIRQVLRVSTLGDIEVSRELAARLRSPGSEAHPIEWRTVDLDN